MKKTYIIVIVILIVGVGIGYWLMQDSDNTKTSNNQTTNQQQNESEESVDPVADSSEGGKYLVIKEWGVKFPVPVNLEQDLYYELSSTIAQSGKTQTIEVARLRSKTLDRIVSSCPDSEKFSLYVHGLARSANQLSENEDIGAVGLNSFNFKNIDNYWYHIIGSGNEGIILQGCPDYKKVSNELDNFKSSSGGAQAIQDSLKGLK